MDEKYPSYMYHEPTCCKEHKLLYSRKRHIDVARWKLMVEPESLHPKKFNPFSRATPTTESKIKGMKDLEKEMDRLRKTTLLKASKDTIKESSPVSQVEKQNEPVEAKKPVIKSPSSEGSEKEVYPEDSGAGEKKTNPYLTLLNKLDEEEERKAPSIEDRLKLVEDRLRVSMMEFCKQTTRLASMKDNEKENEEDAATMSQTDLFIQPETIQNLFRPQVFDPSPCPPVPFDVKEMEMPSQLVITKTKKQEKEWKEKEKKMEEIYKQSYYLPADTWFAPEKKEAITIGPEEVDLFNAFSTREFFKFLEERKREPPKALKKIQDKINQLQCNISQK